MAGKYSVDDILSEVRRKKEVAAEKPVITEPEKKVEAVEEQAPSNAPEITEETAPEEIKIKAEDIKLGAVSEEEPEAKEDLEKTLIISDPVEKEEPSEEISKEEPLEEKKGISNTELLKLRTEEFSALGEKMDKAEAWETFVKITEMRENGDGNGRDSFHEEIDDYVRKEDERSIRYDIKSLRVKVGLRMWVCFIFGAGLLILSLLGLISAKTGFLSEFTGSIVYLPIISALTLIPVLFCISTVSGGMWSLLKMKPDADSPAALGALSVLIFSIVMNLFPEVYLSGSVNLYNAVAVLCLAFNARGKLYVLKRAMCNFGFLTNEADKFAVMPVAAPSLSAKLTRPFEYETEASVMVSRKVGFLKDFLKYSYAEDSGDKTVRVTAIISFFASIAAGVGAFVLRKDIFEAVNIFVLMNVMCASFGQIIYPNIPLYRASKKALRHGGMISGYASVEDLSVTDAIVVDSDELFPEGTIKLHGLKTFEGQRIDEAIIDAASVVMVAGTTLKEVFRDIIDDKKELLKPVDTLVYEDSMGVSGWVDSKRVLIGNRTLMENHNIIVPSKDYEEKYKSEGTEAIYLANSGTLTAMFVVSYNSDRETRDALKKLYRSSVNLLVRTTDPNITREKLSEVFSVPKELFSIVPSALHQDCKAETSPIKTSPASAAHTGRFPAFAATVTASASAKKAIGIASFFSMVGFIIALVIVAMFAVVGFDPKETHETVVLLYHLVLLLFTSVLPSLKSY